METASEYSLLYNEPQKPRNNLTKLIIYYISFCLIFVTLFLIITSIAVIVFIRVFREQPNQPTLVVVNSRVWTGITNEKGEYEYAEAFAVSKNKIIAVGSTNEIVEKYVKGYHKDAIRIIDGNGKYMITPGFIDSHAHLLSGGRYLDGPQLEHAKTPEEFIQILGDFIKGKKEGEWIRGGRFNHLNWGGILPNKTWIDPVSPKNPVYIIRLDGHMALVNSLVLQLANITKYTPEVPGGTIVRDEEGNPTGLLLDEAMNLVTKVIPKEDIATEDRALELGKIKKKNLTIKGQNYVVAHGVTGIVDMGGINSFEIYSRANNTNKLKIRVYASFDLGNWKALSEIVSRRGRGIDEGYLRIGILKGYVDGSLGSSTALMYKPYEGTNNTGLWLTSEKNLYEWTKAADNAGLQVAVHAIGDKANGVMLDIYERVSKENGEKDRRFRIEHSQQVIPEHIERFSQLGVIASFQPIHLLDDAEHAEKLIGNRISDLYVWNSISKKGGTLAFGSDWYVASPSVMHGIYAAVTRITNKYPNGFFPDETISVNEALKAYTTSAAYSCFQEHKLGLIKSGYLADFVVIDRDLNAIEPKTIKDAQILMTVVNGKVVYEKQ